jgi:hypothetical protein
MQSDVYVLISQQPQCSGTQCSSAVDTHSALPRDLGCTLRKALCTVATAYLHTLTHTSCCVVSLCAYGWLRGSAIVLSCV